MNAIPRSEVDIAVIGAGAAGIAAARRLVDAGMSVLVLEARDRPGGRAHTMDAGGMPIDLGCEWLHSADRNLLARIAASSGFGICRDKPEWPLPVHWNGETAEAEADWLRAVAAHQEALFRAACQGRDQPASSILAPGGRWNALLDAYNTWGYAAELDRISLKDAARYRDTGVNWRLPQGFGRLIESLAETLPIAYRTPVSCIRHAGAAITVETARGALRAAQVVVTVPTALIAEERLRFDPVLPDKMEAAAGLPLGIADKLILGFRGSMPESYMVGSTRCRETMNYHVRPMGQPRIGCFFGGELARSLEREGAAAMTAFAIEELVGLMGSRIRHQVTPLAASFWHKDPFSRGSYAYALPGHADDRARLAAPVHGRLFFAGEACSAHFFSTAHGAYETGHTAAEAALQATRTPWRTAA